MRKRVFCLIVSVLLLLGQMNRQPSVHGSSMMVPMDYSSEFYQTQTQSVKAYNEILDGFSGEAVASDFARGNTQEVCDDMVCYPEYYGGAYIEDGTGKLIVLLTDVNDYVCENISSYTENDIKYEQCDVSYNDMLAVIDRITNQIEYYRTLGIDITCVQDNIIDGKVLVTVNGLTSEKANIITEDMGCAYLVFADGTVQEQSSNLGGGYSISSPKGTSTLGFAATRDGVDGYVIAGHACDVGNTISFNGQAIGTVTHSAYYNYSTADAAFVAANENFNPTNILNRVGSRIWGASTLDFPVNTVVYMIGQTSGFTSEKILSINASSKSGDFTFRNQITASYTATGGDSGAPILFYDGNFSGTLAYTLLGIHRSSGADYKVFTKYSEIVAQLGVECIVSQ